MITKWPLWTVYFCSALNLVFLGGKLKNLCHIYLAMTKFKMITSENKKILKTTLPTTIICLCGFHLVVNGRKMENLRCAINYNYIECLCVWEVSRRNPKIQFQFNDELLIPVQHKRLVIFRCHKGFLYYLSDNSNKTTNFFPHTMLVSVCPKAPNDVMKINPNELTMRWFEQKVLKVP